MRRRHRVNKLRHGKLGVLTGLGGRPTTYANRMSPSQQDNHCYYTLHMDQGEPSNRHPALGDDLTTQAILYIQLKAHAERINIARFAKHIAWYIKFIRFINH